MICVSESFATRFTKIIHFSEIPATLPQKLSTAPTQPSPQRPQTPTFWVQNKRTLGQHVYSCRTNTRY